MPLGDDDLTPIPRELPRPPDQERERRRATAEIDGIRAQMQAFGSELEHVRGELNRWLERERLGTAHVEAMFEDRTRYFEGMVVKLRAELDRLSSTVEDVRSELRRLDQAIAGSGGVGELAKNALEIARHLRDRPGR